jgi:hypothetical protein
MGAYRLAVLPPAPEALLAPVAQVLPGVRTSKRHASPRGCVPTRVGLYPDGWVGPWPRGQTSLSGSTRTVNEPSRRTSPSRCVNGHRFLPNYGHQISPLAAIFLPIGGHESPRHRGWCALVATNLPSMRQVGSRPRRAIKASRLQPCRLWAGSASIPLPGVEAARSRRHLTCSSCK